MEHFYATSEDYGGIATLDVERRLAPLDSVIR